MLCHHHGLSFFQICIFKTFSFGIILGLKKSHKEVQRTFVYPLLTFVCLIFKSYITKVHLSKLRDVGTFLRTELQDPAQASTLPSAVMLPQPPLV